MKLRRFSCALLMLALSSSCSGTEMAPAPDVGRLDAGADGGARDAGRDAMAADGGADGGASDASLIDAGADGGNDAYVDHCLGVVCTASDDCHTVGTCDHATGVCSMPMAADDTLCTLAAGPAVCRNGTCTLRCADGSRDGAETDRDCGGGCAGCGVGLMCLVNADCAASACDSVSSQCVSSQCIDHHRDGTESDTDCGGTCTTKCALGRTCGADADCISGACDAITLMCVASQCNDHHRNGSESDTDCGGGTCASCAVGKSCSLDSDCTTSACDAITLTCVVSQCADHRVDGTETDVDCGGPSACSRCVVGLRCMLNSDCTTGHTCAPATHLCI